MRKTVFIAGWLPEAGALSDALQKHSLRVVVLITIEELEQEVDEHLFPDLTILSVTGDRDKDIPFITQVERYPEDRKGNLILIPEQSLDDVEHALFYRPYAKVVFERPIHIEEVVQKVLEMLGLDG